MHSAQITTKVNAVVLTSTSLVGKKCPRKLVVAGSSSKGKSPVKLLRKNGKKWVKIGRAKPNSAGQFSKRIKGKFNTIKVRAINKDGKSPTYKVRKPAGKKCR